jgi:hypothetical protein
MTNIEQCFNSCLEWLNAKHTGDEETAKIKDAEFMRRSAALTVEERDVLYDNYITPLYPRKGKV